MLPKAVTPSNKHTLCQWLFVRPPIDCVILSLWKNTSSGTINYKLLLHTSLAWCCLHPAVIGRSKAKPRSKGRKLLKWTRHHPLHSRQSRRECKIFASGVNFSIFTHFLCFFLLKLLRLGEIDGVKFLAWKSGGVKFWTNSMSVEE